MSNDLISYGEGFELWNPRRSARAFDLMIIGGSIGTGVGIVTNNRPVFAASVANLCAGILGRLILTLFGYGEEVSSTSFLN